MPLGRASARGPLGSQTGTRLTAGFLSLTMRRGPFTACGTGSTAKGKINNDRGERRAAIPITTLLFLAELRAPAERRVPFLALLFDPVLLR